MEELPVVLLGIRTSWREDADTTPAQLVYGTALRVGLGPGWLRLCRASKTSLVRAAGMIGRTAPVETSHHRSAPRYWINLGLTLDSGDL